jgi:hypothetical protein
MANNKISLHNFFEIGGCCVIGYTCILNGEREWCYPKNTMEYNLIATNGLIQIDSVVFLFGDKSYEPLIENKKGMFYYLVVSK